MQNTTWSAAANPTVHAGDWGLASVACPAVKQCFAVGSERNGTTLAPLTERWNGTNWSIG